MSVLTVVKNLKENNQDFEFYPTTNEILSRIKPALLSVIGERYSTQRKSVLDIGAGTCKFKEYMSEFCRFDYYAIEKSQILINNYPDDVIVLGTDFHSNILFDKKVDVIFCNPPYSEYVEWTTKILKEGNAERIYMVIPSRWKDNEQLNNVIETLQIKYNILGSFDFLNAERRARANVDVIEFSKGVEEHYQKDPFSVWFNETFTSPEKENEFFKKYKEKEIESALVSLNNKDRVELLCEYYSQEMEQTQKAFINVCELSPNTLKAIGIDKKAVKTALKNQIANLKLKYWHEFYNCLDVITDRLTSKTRYEMHERFCKLGAIDFTLSNVRTVLLWIVKNTHKYMERQLVDLFKHFSDYENVKMYKSNQKTFTADNWRWNSNNEREKYSLDYRIIACERWNNNYSWKEEIDDRKAKTATDDICTIAFNLGFRCVEKQEVKEFGEKYYYYLSNGKPLFEVKVYKNGNCHYKFNTEFCKAFNIEAGRILGWLRNKQECKEEFDTDKYFGVLNNSQLLLGFEG
jgi:hypothetical protein